MKRRRVDRAVWIREDRLPSLEELTWLASAAGREICRRMAETEPADTPAAIARWRETLAPDQVAAAWGQVVLRKHAAPKFARAGDMLFDRIGLEQCSSELIAAHKARRFVRDWRVADLCCGIGGDTLALADQHNVRAVDRMAGRVFMAAHNARVYGRDAKAVLGDAAEVWPEADAVHIDPDRRPTGRRRHGPEEGSPGLSTLTRVVAHYRNAAIKLSPGADFGELPFECEIELISEHGECKQAVAWMGDLMRARRTATVLPAGGSLSAGPEESLEWPAARPPGAGDFLFEPDPAVVRADLVGVLARRLGLAPIDPRIAWLAGEDPIQDAMAHVFRVLEVRPWSARPARAWLAGHDVGALDIKTRGFAAPPEVILKQLRPIGRRPAVLFLTRLGERPMAILTERVKR